MNIELRVTSESRFEKDSYRQFVALHFKIIGEQLPYVYTGLSEKDLERLHIIVFDGPNTERSYTKPHSTDPFRYVICLVPEDATALPEVIAHELCHVIQFIQGRLKVFTGRNDALVWEGEVFYLQGRPYSKRPWEKEAMFNAHIIYSRLLDGLSSS